jgi:hypothetical protein
MVRSWPRTEARIAVVTVTGRGLGAGHGVLEEHCVRVALTPRLGHTTRQCDLLIDHAGARRIDVDATVTNIATPPGGVITVRSLVVWIPEWSVVAACGMTKNPEAQPGLPLAVVHKGLIRECSSLPHEAGLSGDETSRSPTRLSRSCGVGVSTRTRRCFF